MQEQKYTYGTSQMLDVIKLNQWPTQTGVKLSVIMQTHHRHPCFYDTFHNFFYMYSQY